MSTYFDPPGGGLCDRRELLLRGRGLALASWLLPAWAASRAGTSTASEAPLAVGRARSCILVYLLGGPPHLDTFDLKPDAPAEIRGPFRPIASNVPGTQVCEHLPRLAGMAETFALLRSVSHPNSNHTPMIYYTLTGRHTALPAVDDDVRPPQRSDFPHTGAVVAHFRRAEDSPLPGHVAVPEVATRSSINGEYKRARMPLRGGGAGFLGPACEPLAIDGEPGTAEAIPAVALAAGIGGDRYQGRLEVLAELERSSPQSSWPSELPALRRRAVTLTGVANGFGGGESHAGLFSLDAEPAELRERYGRHRFGRSLLLARRLTEAGVPLVSVNFNEMTICDGWDTHSQNFRACQEELLPMVDQSLSALIEDLSARGRLDETLIVCQGEFGRTPKINANAGRDHWGDCSTTLLAGGGVRGGQVLGESDKHGAFPISHRVDPVDVQATMYHALGLDGELAIVDHSGRPHPIATGRVLSELL